MKASQQKKVLSCFWKKNIFRWEFWSINSTFETRICWSFLWSLRFLCSTVEFAFLLTRKWTELRKKNSKRGKQRNWPSTNFNNFPKTFADSWKLKIIANSMKEKHEKNLFDIVFKKKLVFIRSLSWTNKHAASIFSKKQDWLIKLEKLELRVLLVNLAFSK